MFTELDRSKAVEAAAFKIETDRGLAAIYSKFPLLIPCEANNRALIQACNQYCGGDVAPTVGIFQNILEDNPDLMGQMATRAIDRTRKMLIEDILAILRAKGRSHDSFSLKTEESRLQHFTVDALRSRLEDLRRAANMATTPVAQLKAMVADSHRVESFEGYPILPQAVWDGSKHVKVDAAYLNGLIHTDLYQFKKMCRLYGSTQVDRRRGVSR